MIYSLFSFFVREKYNESYERTILKRAVKLMVQQSLVPHREGDNNRRIMHEAEVENLTNEPEVNIGVL